MLILRPAVWFPLLLLLVGADVYAAPAREAPEGARPRRRVLLTNRVVTRPGQPTGYHGVTPGLPRMPPFHLPKDAKKRCYLTWTGFQMLPTGSRVFLQLTKRPKVKTTAKGAALTVTLSGCRVANWNNTRPLYTRYFPTPVRYARVHRRGRSTVMTVLFKRAVATRTRVVQLQGYYYVFLSFRHTRSGWAPRVRRTRRSRRGRPRRRRSTRRGPQP